MSPSNRSSSSVPLGLQIVKNNNLTYYSEFFRFCSHSGLSTFSLPLLPPFRGMLRSRAIYSPAKGVSLLLKRGVCALAKKTPISVISGLFRSKMNSAWVAFLLVGLCGSLVSSQQECPTDTFCPASIRIRSDPSPGVCEEGADTDTIRSVQLSFLFLDSEYTILSKNVCKDKIGPKKFWGITQEWYVSIIACTVSATS